MAHRPCDPGLQQRRQSSKGCERGKQAIYQAVVRTRKDSCRLQQWKKGSVCRMPARGGHGWMNGFDLI